MAQQPTKFSQIVNEKSNAIYTIALFDINNVAILLADIDSLTISLCNAADGVIINGRDDLDALNLNDVVVTAGGVLTFNLTPDDTAIVDISSILEFEIHRATFKMRFNSISFSNWDIDISVRNLLHVT